MPYTALGITTPVEHNCPAELVRIRRDEKAALLAIAQAAAGYVDFDRGLSWISFEDHLRRIGEAVDAWRKIPA